MAVGDVVSAIGTDNTILNFQPAGSNEVMITITGCTIGGWIYLTNGVLTSGVAITFGGNADDSNQMSKLFLTNSLYLQMPANGVGRVPSYSGIQIK